MKAVNLSKILKNYTSGWISLSHDQKKVIVQDKTLEGVLEKLKKIGNPKGFLMKAVKDYSHYAG